MASERSIACAIAQAMHRQGAELAFTYQTEKLQPRVEKYAGSVNSDIVLPLDVGHDDQIAAVFESLEDFWDGLDIVIHAVAFAPRDQLEGLYLDSVTREGFQTAHDISSYSFAALAKGAPWIYEAWDEVKMPENLSGGGGTSFVPVFNWISQQDISPELLVYFTDAEGEFPIYEPSYPVIWLVKGKEKTPWGQRVQLN